MTPYDDGGVEQVGVRVLLVDDEEDIRLLVRLTLQRAGLRVIEAGSGADALAILAAEPVDVVVLDVRMPEPDGWAVLDSMRERGTLARVGVVMMSAHADPAMGEQAMRLGCRGYVSKPFDPLELLAAVQHAADPAVKR